MPTVLLVEDDAALRLVLGDLLRGEGFHVLEAETGRQAVKLLKGAVPDVVISDIVMPEEDGIALATMMRREFPSVPLIAMSGSTAHSPLYLQMAKMLGARMVFEKPFKPDALLLAIKGALS